METVTIRASALNYWADCPRRAATGLFRRQIRNAGYILRELPFGVGGAIGRALHKAAETALAQKARNGTLPNFVTVAEIAGEQFRATVRDGVMWDQATPEIVAGLTQVARMAHSYLRHIAPLVNPILVEEKLEAQVTPHIILAGHPDVIAREPGRVRDLKSGKHRTNCKPQLGAYSLLARTEGLDISEVAEDYVPRVGTKHSQPAPRSYMHDVGDTETAAIAVLTDIETGIRTFVTGDMKRRINAGDPWAFMANPLSRLCGDKYCPAHGTDFCKEWMEK